MFKTYEIVGFGVIVGLMLLTIWAVQTEHRFAQFFTATEQPAAAGTVTIDSDAGTTWEQAVQDSVDESGAISNLIVDTVQAGSGDPVEEGDTVRVHYVGTLPNGQEFDNSRTRGEPFTFTVGDGQVIEGWEEGVLGMREGGTRILVIPPDMAYGSRGQGPIPPNATLVFSVELLEIE